MRLLVREAFRRRFVREPNRSEAQCMQGIAILETSCGSGWHKPSSWPLGAIFDPENMGAIQKGGWSGRTFTYTDTHPNADGTSTPYRIEFRYYDCAQAGTDDLGRVVYAILDRTRQVLAPATRGDIFGVSAGLHSTGYYEGFGKTPTERIANHCRALRNAIAHQCAAIGEDMPDGGAVNPKPMLPTLRLGARTAAGGPVGALQAALHVGVDGIFGRDTLGAVVAFQRAHGLKADGVVGHATWAALGLGV
jgi:peptidoglycan hydrolase-like protein with peptidoglycan-binding domain